MSSCLRGKEEWQCAAVKAILGSNAHDGGGGTVISAAGVCSRAHSRMWSPHEGQSFRGLTIRELVFVITQPFPGISRTRATTCIPREGDDLTRVYEAVLPT